MHNTSSTVLRSLRHARHTSQLAGRKRTWQRSFNTTPHLDVVKPFVLADIGEGITEVQIIQWFVQPGARVQQFDKLCEVQSDKASVEITSRFDGVIKKLHYEQDDTAKVGKALCDIDIEGDISPQDEALVSPEGEQAGTPDDAQQPQKAAGELSPKGDGKSTQQTIATSSAPPRNRHASNLATPAVRGLLRELDVNIEDVEGTGRDGRVTKEDVRSYVACREAQSSSSSISPGASNAAPPRPRPITIDDGPQRETPVTLTPIQAQMFKVMTRSLSIPHFLYADEIDLTALSTLRQNLNSNLSSSTSSNLKLSFLPFVIKAVSLALHSFPLLNSRVQAPSDSPNTSPPKLIMREKHNIGIAMDTPQGLLVPNIKNVSALSIRDIAEQLAYLQSQAQAGKLSASDLAGGTITVSNVGNIGGTYVAPVIVQSEVAILGMGRAKVVPAFDDKGNVVRKMQGNFSWSADHRVVDGATMARMGEKVRGYIEEPGSMMAEMR